MRSQCDSMGGEERRHVRIRKGGNFAIGQMLP
jgi:hypothetical protein